MELMSSPLLKADLVVEVHFCMDGEIFGLIERTLPFHLGLDLFTGRFQSGNRPQQSQRAMLMKLRLFRRLLIPLNGF